MGKKKKEQQGKKGLADWMATYSDMVTLLFCFFLILYSTATKDEARIQYIFSSYANGGSFINTVVSDVPNSLEGEGNSNVPPLVPGTGGDGGTLTTVGAGNQIDSFMRLFNWVASVAEGEDVKESVSVTGSQTQIKILFDNDVLFNPDSPVLTSSGSRTLSYFVKGISAMRSSVGSVEVSGHTAAVQSVSPVNDWDLSALRASAVLKYFDYYRMVDSEIMRLDAFGPHKPISSNETEDGRAKNRRVEVTLNRTDTTSIQGEILEDILKYDYNQSMKLVDSEGNPIDPALPEASDAIKDIINNIESKYGDKGTTDLDQAGNEIVGPSLGDNLLDIPDSEFLPVEGEGTSSEGETSAGEETTTSEGATANEETPPAEE